MFITFSFTNFINFTNFKLNYYHLFKISYYLFDINVLFRYYISIDNLIFINLIKIIFNQLNLSILSIYSNYNFG